MTKRALLVLLCALVILICALSTRGAIFWLLFWVLGMMIFLSLFAVLWTRATIAVSCALDNKKVDRGARVTLTIAVTHRCPLPVGALEFDVCATNGAGTLALFAPVTPFQENMLAYQLACPHIGVFPSGVSGVTIRDVFGLFSLERVVFSQETELIVLPQVYLTAPLRFSPGESDSESALARAFEDATMPTDLRAFQQGDELKKVHWKLSMRRKELLVRVYEQPQRPDALLLVDCAPPDAPPEMQDSVRDAICEAAASIALSALQNSAPVRMPLLSEESVDINVSKAEELGVVRDALARCAFDGAQEFERVLLLETRRMRRTGTTAVITSRMNPVIADMLLRIRRMGPRVRVLLAADAEEEFTAVLITRLMRNDVEVETIET